MDPIFAPRIGNPSERDLFRRQGFFPENYRGTVSAAPAFGNVASGAAANAELWGNQAMSDDRYALALNQILFKKQRAAALNAQQAEALRKIKLFDTMSPEETAGLYRDYDSWNGVNFGDDPTEAQAIVRGYTPTRYSYDDLAKRNLDQKKNLQGDELFTRNIRDSDFNFTRNQEAAEREAEKFDFNMDLALENAARQREQLELNQRKAMDTTDVRRQKLAEQNASRNYKQAEDLIYSDAIKSEADINRMFPSLQKTERDALVAQLRAQNEERRKLLSTLSSEAGPYNERLEKARAAATDRLRQEDAAKQTAWYNPTGWFTPEYEYSRGGGLEREEQAVIDEVRQFNKNLVYDPALRKMVPGPLFADSSPSPSMASPSSVAPQARPVNPLFQAFDLMGTPQSPFSKSEIEQARAGGFLIGGTSQPAPSPSTPRAPLNIRLNPNNNYGPAAGGGGGINSQRFAQPAPQARPQTGDSQIDYFNVSMTDEDRAELRRGDRRKLPNGKSMVYNGYWFQPL